VIESVPDHKRKSGDFPTSDVFSLIGSAERGCSRLARNSGKTGFLGVAVLRPTPVDHGTITVRQKQTDYAMTSISYLKGCR
jgi:hypothetical protein